MRRLQPMRRIALLLLVVALAGCGGGNAGTRLSLYTHCGVVSAHVDGKLWLAKPPLTDGSGNPLPGWDPNDTRGRWTATGSTAEFRSDSGKRARFVLAPAGAKDPNRGCE
jgi:hypothetical protein